MNCFQCCSSVFLFLAFRSAPDEDGWISITAEPVEEKDINSLVAAAMEKPAVSEQAAATAPAEETEPVDRYEYQYPPIELFEKTQEESDPGAQEELKANARSWWTRWKASACAPGAGYLPRTLCHPVRAAAHGRRKDQPHHLAGGRYRLNLAVADVRMEAPSPASPP